MTKAGKKGKAVTGDSDAFNKMARDMSDNLFDGHTEFNVLNPEQKLAWLSACARFVYESKQKKISNSRKSHDRQR
jgi:hypothetical protein